MVTVSADGRALKQIVIFTTRSPGNRFRKCPSRINSGDPNGWGTIHHVEDASQSPESPETNAQVNTFDDKSQ
jgi:hypothetical protein